MNIQKIWEDAKKEMHGRVSQVSFDLWIKPLVAEAFEDGEFILAANSTMGKQQAENTRHFVHIESVIKELAPIVEKVKIIDAIERERRQHDVVSDSKAEITPKKPTSFITVNHNQTFDNFIVGKSNQIVCAASESVAKKPGKSINPLFIYGGSGLGKTHLLNAIVNHIMETSPKMSIAFATSEKFTNDFVQTMMNSKSNAVAAFREKYRNADILLIDDIQFIRDKKGTQEEFFHTFNDLIQNGRQVVLTSDRHPDEMPTLEDRMRSRFKSGLIQDITHPDVEMWMAILQKKANSENYRLSDEICTYLAKHAHERDLNVREMEGNLTKIIFYASLKGKTEPDIDDCEAALKEVQDTSKYQTTAEKIIGEVVKYFNITRDDIVGKRRNREFVEPRMIAIYLIAEFLDIPLISIGQLIGGRDHTTVMHSRNKIEGQLAHGDLRIKRIVSDISKMVNNE
ncbi:MAG: chromosomal replication initiator protein DnaA [Christensenellaceae bacterium]|jgi:chromosomal replication initiator protein|nr:chromosomal replication initiator protein DnaA [Christensenellaceae bacterium]